MALNARLLSRSVNSKLPYGSIKAAAQEFNIHLRTVNRIWKRRSDADEDVGPISAMMNRIKDPVCRPSIDAKIVNDALVFVPVRNRQTLCNESAATEFSISTLWRMLKPAEIRRVSNKMKPLLSVENKLDRVRWALLMNFPQTLVFESMHDYVVLEEKWFYVPETTRKF